MQFQIKNQQGRLLGVADVATASGTRMEGRFEPSPEFAPYAPMFLALEQAVGDGAEDEAADEAARLRLNIDGLGLHATGPLPLPTSAAIEAVEIAGDRIRFRLAKASTDKPGP